MEFYSNEEDLTVEYDGQESRLISFIVVRLYFLPFFNYHTVFGERNISNGIFHQTLDGTAWIPWFDYSQTTYLICHRSMCCHHARWKTYRWGLEFLPQVSHQPTEPLWHHKSWSIMPFIQSPMDLQFFMLPPSIRPAQSKTSQTSTGWWVTFSISFINDFFWNIPSTSDSIKSFLVCLYIMVE